MSDLPAFSAADMDAARERTRAEVTASIQAEHKTALDAVRADADARLNAIIEGATKLAPENARLGAYFKATSKGMSPTDAAELAGMIPAPAAAEPTGRREDVAQVLAGQAPGIRAEGEPSGNAPAAPEDARAARQREIASIKVKL